jgi:hypothetical protein
VREQLVDHHNDHDRAGDARDHGDRGRRAHADYDRARAQADYDHAEADYDRARANADLDRPREHGDRARRARADHDLLSSRCESVLRRRRCRPRL